MTQQEQIDSLKRVVAVLEVEVRHMRRLLAADSPGQPYCGNCGYQMYDGFECSKPASECVMGVGRPEE